ncbi:MAG: DUF523 domain-containing protein [Planctomycetota bacterium]
MSERQRVLVSACLLGRRCTYVATHNRDAQLERRLDDEGLEPVPFCPEEHGGLGTPRPPADLTASAEDVLDGDGRVVTHVGGEVLPGPGVTAALLRRHGIECEGVEGRRTAEQGEGNGGSAPG